MIPRDLCPRGHDNASPYTRYKSGWCRECCLNSKRDARRAAGELTWEEWQAVRQRSCHKGHIRTPENTYVGPQGWLTCRVCVRERQRVKRPDPEGRSDRNERNRIYLEGRRRAMGIKPMNWSAASLAKRTRPPTGPAKREVVTAPFLKWLDDWLVLHPDISEEQLALSAASAARSVYSWRSGAVATLRLEVADRFLIAAGEPAYILDELYPLDDHTFAVAA